MPKDNVPYVSLFPIWINSFRSQCSVHLVPLFPAENGPLPVFPNTLNIASSTPRSTVCFSTDRCDSVTCEEWEKCKYDVSTGPKCVCREALDCPPDFKPVCGSNAAKYNNYCSLKAEACRKGTTLEKVADGSCTPSK